MFLHFESWPLQIFAPKLKVKDMPHEGRLIKVYTTYQDPRQLIDRPSLVVIESDHSQFRAEEVFHYEGRESHSGTDLEAKFAELGLNAGAKDTVRSLFRFASRQDIGFCQAMMTARREGKWKFEHPLEGLDGIDLSELPAHKPGPEIHIDLFHPESMRKLRNILNIDDEKQILKHREHVLLDRIILAEGQRRGIER